LSPSNNPSVADIELVIQHLVSTPPSVQKAAVEKYFTSDGQFVHPFCRTINFANSRYQVERIYRWYKILSPKISAKVHSVSFDEKNNVLYVGLTQVFAIWAIPTHRSEVSLVTVLHLVQGPEKDVTVLDSTGIPTGQAKNKWYIQSQNDLYQTDQFIKFVLPWLAWLVPLQQWIATLVCIFFSYVFEPLTWWEENKQAHFVRPELPPVWDDGK